MDKHTIFEGPSILRELNGRGRCSERAQPSILLPSLKHFRPHNLDSHARKRHLLLRRRTLVLLSLGPLLPNPHQPRLAPLVPQHTIRILGPLPHLALLYLPNRTNLALIHNAHRVSHLADHILALAEHGLDRLGVRVVGFLLAGLAREDDEAGLVGLEAGHVGGEGFSRQVAAARVDRDADCGGVFAGDAGFLERERERRLSIGMGDADGVGLCTFSSSKVKPRPARIFRLYFWKMSDFVLD